MARIRGLFGADFLPYRPFPSRTGLGFCLFTHARSRAPHTLFRYPGIDPHAPPSISIHVYGASRAKDIPETEVLSLEAGAILTSIVVYCFNWSAYIIRCDVSR